MSGADDRRRVASHAATARSSACRAAASLTDFADKINADPGVAGRR